MKNKHQLKPTVSVRFMVYNNEPYIREAIEGILIQQTNFLVEIVVGDDFSTDNTLNIIKEYKDTKNIYFNILQRDVGGTYWKDRERLGRLHNFRNIIENCSGKYIALLDGDDYWTDPLKLQKQVDFLEENDDYCICFHEASILWGYSNFNSNIKLNSQFAWNNMEVSKSVYNISDVFNGPFMATASVIFRNDDIKEFPYWFYKVASGDVTLYSLILGDKKIKFINEVMCVYRRHPESITGLYKGNSVILNRIKTLKHINNYYKNVYFDNIQKSVSDYLDGISKLNLKEYITLVEVYLTSKLIKKKHLIFFLKKGLKDKLKR